MKMRYYKLLYDYEQDDNYANCDMANIGNINEYVTSNGRVIDEWGDVVLRYNSKKGKILSDYLANLYRWFVVSNTFKEATENIFEKDIQYLPVKVVDECTGIETTSYYVANIITTIDAFDMQKSKYDIFELDDEKIISVEKYVLKGNSLMGKHIFRLKNDTIPIFVSETVKRIVEDNNLVGFVFLEVSIS